MNEDVKKSSMHIHSRADELIACLEGEIAKRDETIARLEADNRSKNGSMKAFGEQIAGLQKAVRNRERLVGLRDARIVELESDLAGTQSRVLSLQDQWRKLDAELAALKAQYQRDVWGLNNEGDPIGGEPAGVDGLEVIGWYTDDHLDDKSATTYSREVADRWLAKGWPITGIANAADAQAIIDGLRGEVADLLSMLATVSKAGLRVRTERDQQAQRIGELEQILRDLVPGCKWRFMRPRIDSALSAGKD